MSTIAIIGATGYAGRNIATEALRRGHTVIGVSRNAPTDAPEGMSVRTGSIADTALLDDLAAQADVLVVAVHALDGDTPLLIPALPHLLTAAGKGHARLGFVGGAGSLHVSPGGPRLIDTPGFPDAYKPEATTHAGVLEALRASGTDVDWFYVSPAPAFGSNDPGERTGSYRTGEDTVIDGGDHISGADYAIAFVDEIERPAHHRARFAVAS